MSTKYAFKKHWSANFVEFCRIVSNCAQCCPIFSCVILAAVEFIFPQSGAMLVCAARRKYHPSECLKVCQICPGSKGFIGTPKYFVHHWTKDAQSITVMSIRAITTAPREQDGKDRKRSSQQVAASRRHRSLQASQTEALTRRRRSSSNCYLDCMPRKRDLMQSAEFV